MLGRSLGLLAMLLCRGFPLLAQGQDEHGALGFYRTWYSLDSRFESGTGYGLLIQPKVSRPVYLDLGLSAVTRSHGGYPLSAGVVELGLAVKQRLAWLTASGGLGLAGTVGGDDDGGNYGAMGPYADIQLTLWPLRLGGVTARFTAYAFHEPVRHALWVGLTLGW